MKKFSTMEEFIAGFPEWSPVIKELRTIALSTGLTEAIKWGAPAYLYESKIVLGIGAFKSYVGLWFHQGALLKDASHQLMNAQEGKTKALRQWRFADVKDIDAALVKQYMEESIAHFKMGKEIKPQKNKPLILPVELTNAMQTNISLANQFKSLTLSKQREYAEYITEAKRAETKLNRLQKIIPMIEKGMGLNDRYKNC